MIKTLIIVFLVVVTTLSSFGQEIISDSSNIVKVDTIVFISGEVVVANIVSIDKPVIKYKLVGEQSVHFKPLNLIYQIRMGNGKVVDYNNSADKNNTNSSSSQETNSDTTVAVMTDTLIYKTGEIIIAKVISIEENTIEYALKGDDKIHYTSFYIIDQVKMSNGDIVENKTEPLEVRNLKIRGKDPLKRKGHLIVNSYLSSLVMDRRGYKNNLLSLGTMYYFSNQISVGAAYQLGLKKDIYRNNYIHVSQAYDFNAGWIGSTHRRMDFGFRVGLSLMSFEYDLTWEDHTLIWLENVPSDPYGTEYNGVLYSISDYSLKETIHEHHKKTSLNPYLGLETNIVIIPRLSVNIMGAIRKEDPYYRYGNYPRNRLEHNEYYRLNGDLAHRNVVDIGDYSTRKRLLMPFIRFSVNYHFLPKSDKVK